MAPRAALFRQVDVKRAVKGALAAGLPVGRVEVGGDGTIVIVAVDGNRQQDEFELWKAKHHAGKSS